MWDVLPLLDILGLLSKEGGGGLSIRRVAKRRLQVLVYFYLKSNLPSLINDFNEGSDSVPGDGEREKRARERALPALFGPWLEEKAEFQPWLGRERDSCVLCSELRCWLKNPDLRSAGTAWLYHSEHRGLTWCSTARHGLGGLWVERA